MLWFCLLCWQQGPFHKTFRILGLTEIYIVILIQITQYLSFITTAQIWCHVEMFTDINKFTYVCEQNEKISKTKQWTY